MAFHNKILFLFFISFCLLISFHLTKSELSPDISPTPEPPESSISASPEPTFILSPSPAPAPADYSSTENYISYPPSSSISDPPSISISPNSAFAPTLSDDDQNQLFNFDDFSIPPSSITVNQVDPELKKICDSTDYPPLCLAIVLPSINEKPNISYVLELTVKASITYAKNAILLAKKKISENLDNKNSNDDDLPGILHECSDIYNDAVYNFENVLAAFPERDIGTMNSMLSAVITDVGDCEDALAEVGVDSPLAGYADKLTNITSNCLAMVSLMHNS